MQIRTTINRTATVIFLVLLMVIFLFPLYFTVISSVKSTTEIFASPLIPTSNPNLANFSMAWLNGKIGVAFLNSVVLSLGTIIIVVLVSSMASYMFARFNFGMSGFLYLLFVMGLMIPVQAIIIPLAIQITSLGLRGNYIVIILVFSAQFLPLATFVLTGFMRTIPTTLEEAAYVDGAKHLYIFSRIILPLSKGGISTVIIFVYLYTWNDLLIPLVFTVSESQRTLSLGLLAFFGGMTGQSSYGAFMAAVLIASIPPIVTYILASDIVEKGLTSSAIKE